MTERCKHLCKTPLNVCLCACLFQFLVETEEENCYLNSCWNVNTIISDKLCRRPIPLLKPIYCQQIISEIFVIYYDVHFAKHNCIPDEITNKH